MSSAGGTPTVLARSEYAKKRFQKKMLEEREQEAQERMRFRARECEVTRRKPFQPILPHNFIKPDDVVLHSTVRAEERRRFDEFLDEKTKEKMRLAEEERIRQEQAEEEALKVYRQKLEFKARPMPQIYSTVAYQVQPSTKQLTVPATPLVLKRNNSK